MMGQEREFSVNLSSILRMQAGFWHGIGDWGMGAGAGRRLLGGVGAALTTLTFVTILLTVAATQTVLALTVDDARRSPVVGPQPIGEILAEVQSSDKSVTPEAVSVAVLGDASKTTFQLTLSRGVTAEVYSLANPYRVIIDLPDVSFRLPEQAGRAGRGLVQAFRYGLFAEGKARVVIDTTGPVQIGKAEMTRSGDGSGVMLAIDIAATDAGSFGNGTGAAKPPPAPLKGSVSDEPATPPPGRTKPVIMIDPGHGGVDPGAVGSANLLEKTIVLAVARQVQAKLAASGRYDVVMTRSSDVFVSLDQRLRLSRTHAADLFISIHADSIEEAAAAQNIKGATVYTLSERASDAEARAIAEKENASDLIAGLQVADGEESGQVKSILIDLIKRETANFSADFSRTLVGMMKQSVSLSRDPQRSAAFKVLKQTHAPSVLVELGYVSNVNEAKLMMSADWQKRVAGSLAKAVDTFFAKRTARTP